MAKKSGVRGPKFVRYFGPVVDALKTLGGSGRPAEVRDVIVEKLGISEAEQAETIKSGISRFDNQVAWARFYLAKAGIIDSSAHGVWTLSEKGRVLNILTHDDALRVFKEVHAIFHADRLAKEVLEEEESDEIPPQNTAPVSNNYQQRVLEILRGIPAAGFERFCQRLLRESGFQEVSVTGRSGDGGIDGVGILQLGPLVSFKVLFQCKRYVGTVVPSQVRDFRGAMQGRADKGILITTGTFTSDAKKEAVRDGVPPIDLVDGERLVMMLEKLELGLQPMKAFEVQESFFDEFKN